MNVGEGTPDIPGYRDLTLIGRGGFASVYRAREDAFDRDVAIKILDAEDVAPEVRERFERECRAIGSLSSNPGIVTVHAAGTTATGRPYLVMEYVGGGSLATRLKNGPLPPAEAARIALALAEALQQAHGRDIVHRDIKPDNVLLSDGRPVLGDFGISSMPGAYQTRTGELSATIGYAAPEVLDGGRATFPSDLYSLAATVASLLIGRPLFRGDGEDSLVAQINRILREDPPDLTAYGASPELAEVLRRNLAKTPDQRHASAGELALALRRTPEVTGAAAGVAEILPPPGPSPVASDEIEVRTMLRGQLPPRTAVPAGPPVAGADATVMRRPSPPSVPPPAASAVPASAPTEPAAPAEPAVGEQRHRRRRIGILAAGTVVLALVGGGIAMALSSPEERPRPVAQSPAPSTTPATPTPPPVEVVRRAIRVEVDGSRLEVVVDRGPRCGAGAVYDLQRLRRTWSKVSEFRLAAARAEMRVEPGTYRVWARPATGENLTCPAVLSRQVSRLAPTPTATPTRTPYHPPPPPPSTPKPPSLQEPVKPQ